MLYIACANWEVLFFCGYLCLLAVLLVVLLTREEALELTREEDWELALELRRLPVTEPRGDMPVEGGGGGGGGGIKGDEGKKGRREEGGMGRGEGEREELMCAL